MIHQEIARQRRFLASENDLLSIDLLQEVCGNEDLETVEEVEIIFNAIAEISNLDRCINLRSLSLIGVGLKRISNLQCVGHCLERLSLSENAITRIENLYLPNLRELYLHQNSICRISKALRVAQNCSACGLPTIA